MDLIMSLSQKPFIVTRLSNATAQMRYNEIFVATITGVTIVLNHQEFSRLFS
jgi:hypothetical protein